MKQPKFYCESCGAEVRHNAKVCPACGKFFTSVKCPKCLHIGSEKDFASGCPVCGYSMATGVGDPGFGPTKPAQAVPALSPFVFFAVFGLLAMAVAVLVVTLLR